MDKIRISAWTLLPVVLMVACVVEGQSASLSKRVLAYSKKPSPHSSSFLLKSSRGITYRLSLIPDIDVGKHVVVLDLALQRPGEGADGTNLLDSTGKLHGYQPYVFAASDFAGGAQRSAYGDSREIVLQKLGVALHIKVADVHVETTPTGSFQTLGYQFDDLILEITTQKLAEGSFSKPGL
jgi:hypothetical protein